MVTQLRRLAVLIPVTAVFGLYLAAALLVTLVSGDAAAGAAAAYLVIFIVVLVWRRQRPMRFALPNTDLARQNPGRYWALVAVTLALCWITGQLAASWVYQNMGSEQFDHTVAMQAETPLLLLMVSTLVLAPLGEEALMRGVAYPMLRRLFTPAIAAVVTASAFALIHGNLVQITVAIPLGVLLAFVYERTERLWPVILLHMGFNAAAMLTPASLIAGLAVLPVIVCGVGVTAAGLWAIRPGRASGAASGLQPSA